jgi:hypothetical protein
VCVCVCVCKRVLPRYKTGNHYNVRVDSTSHSTSSKWTLIVYGFVGNHFFFTLRCLHSYVGYILYNVLNIFIRVLYTAVQRAVKMFHWKRSVESVSPSKWNPSVRYTSFINISTTNFWWTHGDNIATHHNRPTHELWKLILWLAYFTYFTYWLFLITRVYIYIYIYTYRQGCSLTFFESILCYYVPKHGLLIQYK